MKHQNYNKRLKNYIKIADSQKNQFSANEETALFLCINNNDEIAKTKAINILVSANLDLAVAMAHKYSKRGMDLDELISEANIALMKAVDSYDCTKKSGNFRSFASSVIANELKDFCWKGNKIISMPSKINRQIYKMKNIEEDLAHQLGRTPTISEIAEECNCSDKKIRELKAISLDCERVDSYYEDSLKDILSDISSLEISKDELIAYLNSALTKLPELHYKVIKYSFNLTQDMEQKRQLTPKEICSILNCTPQMLNKLQIEAINSLKTIMDEKLKSN